MKSLILILISAALSVASVVVIASDGNDSAAASPSTETLWKCRSCNLDYRLTAQEVLELSNGPYDGSRPLVCPKCKSQGAFLARECSKCNTAYLGTEVEGGTSACPKCSETPLNAPSREQNALPIQREQAPEPSRPPVKVI